MTTIIPSWYRPPAHHQREHAVNVARRMLGMPPGKEDAEFEAAILGFLVGRGEEPLPDHAALNYRTASLLGEREGHGLPPAWWDGDGRYGAYEDELIPHGITGEPALRRFQSESGIPPTGVVDKETATALGVFE